jgi:hypothetical protein
MRHKHADLIHAWAEGAEIQILNKRDGLWHVIAWPDWDDCCEYRIKPEKKPDDVGYIGVYIASDGAWYVSDAYEESKNVPATNAGTKRAGILMVTQSGETGKLIKAEVL